MLDFDFIICICSYNSKKKMNKKIFIIGRNYLLLENYYY